jgi:Fe-S cluster assembly iron-binding protein IscA
MPVKLNLSISESAAKRIKDYAAKNNTSVSKIAEEQFNKLTVKTKKRDNRISFVERTAGIIVDLRIEDIDNARDEYLKKKYGL